MIIRNVVKRIVNRFQGAIPAEAEMKYLLSQGFKVGKNFRNHSDYAIDGLFPWLITIGDNVCLSANVKILAHDTSTEYVNGHNKIGTVTIGNNVYVGYGAIILCNVRIGDHVIIGAGSVVTKDIPTGTVYAGNPAQFICTIEEYKAKHIAQLEKAPVYDGPVAKWQGLSVGEKEAMRNSLKDTFGYMK